jgi:hypothetical protein
MISSLRHCLIWAVVGILTLAPAFGAAASDDAVPIRFRYAFVAYNPSPSGGELVPITRDTALTTGDYFKFFIEKETPCHVYLVYLSAQKDIHLLFPPAPGQAAPETSVPFYIPDAKNWFRLDEQTGEERFYLLAADQRLQTLEDLFTRLTAVDADADKDLIRVQITGEIRRLRWENRNFKRAAERPVAIMGQLRGAPGAEMPPPKEISDLAIAVSGEGFYSKAFTIDHR